MYSPSYMLDEKSTKSVTALIQDKIWWTKHGSTTYTKDHRILVECELYSAGYKEIFYGMRAWVDSTKSFVNIGSWQILYDGTKKLCKR